MRPIFLLSVERSGTTFLARAMEGIDAIRSIPEFQIKTRLTQPSSLLHRVSNTDQKAKYWEKFLTDWPDTVPLRDRVSELVMNSLGECAPQPLYWFDHTPSNARNYLLLREAFPDALWLGLIRDPRASFMSWSRQPWGVDKVENFCTAWTYLCGALDCAREEGVLAGIVYFEKLLADIDSEMTSVADSLDLKWSGLPREAGFPITGSTHDQHQNVNRAPDEGKRLAWQEKIAQADLLKLERNLNIQMRRHGFECHTPLRTLHKTALLPRKGASFQRRIRKWLD